MLFAQRIVSVVVVIRHHFLFRVVVHYNPVVCLSRNCHERNDCRLFVHVPVGYQYVYLYDTEYTVAGTSTVITTDCMYVVPVWYVCILSRH
jgi:hypothetical protein